MPRAQSARRTRRMADGAIDFGYYERRAKRLREHAMRVWFARLAALFRSGNKSCGRRD